MKPPPPAKAKAKAAQAKAAAAKAAAKGGAPAPSVATGAGGASGQGAPVGDSPKDKVDDPHMLRKADKLRVQLLTQLGKAHTLQKEIPKNEQWKFARNPQHEGELGELVVSLEQTIAAGSFGPWLTDEVREVAKTTEAKTMKKVCAEFAKLSAPLDLLTKKMDKLQKANRIEHA